MEYVIGTTLEKKIHALGSRLIGKQAYLSKKGTKNLIEYIEEIRPDVIHLHNLHGNYVNLGKLLQYIAEKNIPTVLTLHDCWFFTGKCTHYTVDNCSRWQEDCGKCVRLKKDNKSWFFDFTKIMLKDKKGWYENIPRLAVVGVSDWIADEARKSILSCTESITRIYNWVDFETFKPLQANDIKLQLGIQDKFVLLGVASKWTDNKGLGKFIELSSKISKDEILVLIGQIGNQIKLPNNIIHVDETHNARELAKYYSMADIFLNLSKEESFGKVTAEALACGTPVITNDLTANKELIGENCGIVLDSNNITSLLQSIKQIRNNGKQKYSGFCVKYAKENFDMEARLKDYYNLYKKLRESGNEQ